MKIEKIKFVTCLELLETAYHTRVYRYMYKYVILSIFFSLHRYILLWT